MNEANPRSGPNAPEIAGGHAPGAPDEHLPTTRLPPVTSPPLGRSGRPASPLSPSTPLAPTVEKEPPHSQPRPSSAPSRAPTPAERAAQEERLLRRWIGVGCAVLGLALAVAGLAVGLIIGIWGVSASESPGVAAGAALVVTRGVIVLGMLAFGSGLIFFATRLLLGRDLPGDGGPQHRQG